MIDSSATPRNGSASQAHIRARGANRVAAAIASGFGELEVDFPTLTAWFILVSGFVAMIVATKGL